MMHLGRKRKTQAEMDGLKNSVMALCREHRPLSVRQLFYLLVTAGLIEKTEKSYKQIIRISGLLRTSGEMPFHWIRDDSRRRMELSLHKSPAEAIRDMADNYQFDYQSFQSNRLEVWCEKETLSGVLWSVCCQYRVDLLPCKGMPSLTYRYEAAAAANNDGRPFKVIYIGDSDPTGEQIDPVINGFMAEYLNVKWLGIERVAVTDSQRRSMNLPTRPPKETGARAGRHADIGCVEVEAIPPDTLRQILADAIEANLDKDALNRARLEDAAHRKTIDSIVENLGGLEIDGSHEKAGQTSHEIVLYEDLFKPMSRSNPLYKSFWRDGWGKNASLKEADLGKWIDLAASDGTVLMRAYKMRKNAIVLIAPRTQADPSSN